MGTKPEARFRFIQERAEFADAEEAGYLRVSRWASRERHQTPADPAAACGPRLSGAGRADVFLAARPSLSGRERGFRAGIARPNGARRFRSRRPTARRCMRSTARAKPASRRCFSSSATPTGSAITAFLRRRWPRAASACWRFPIAATRDRPARRARTDC